MQQVQRYKPTFRPSRCMLFLRPLLPTLAVCLGARALQACSQTATFVGRSVRSTSSPPPSTPLPSHLHESTWGMTWGTLQACCCHPSSSIRKMGIAVAFLVMMVQLVSAQSEWNTAHATFYGGSDAGGTEGGACGYGDLYSTGYGTITVAISSALFDRGLACGACYEVKCAGSSSDCHPGSPTIQVTVTNFCPPNPSLPDNNGGWCNLPLHHFDMSEPAFQQIANYKSAIVPMMYRRTSCMKTGGIRFSMSGHDFMTLVLVTNVGGMGDVQSVSIRGSKTKWVAMTRSFGQIWQSIVNMGGQSLSFMVTTSDGETLVSNEVAPPDWAFGQTYEGSQF